MEYGETMSRDKNENVEAADIDEIEKTKSAMVSNTKEKITIKSLNGKRKDSKNSSFRWTTYLRVREEIINITIFIIIFVD